MARPLRGERHREDRFAELEAFLEEHGKQPSERAEDRKQRELALWFRKQCHALMRGELPEKRAEKLRALDAQPAARLETWAREIGAGTDALRRRLRDITGIDGLTIGGKLLHGAFYTRAQVEGYCPDLLVSPDAVCSVLRERFTPEQWVQLTMVQRKTIEVHGKKIKAIAKFLGIEGNPMSTTIAHLQLGEAIFGSRRLFSELLAGPKEVRSELQKRFTPEQWVQLTVRAREAIEVHGKKLKAVARLLGVEGNPLQNNEAHLQLGEAIFGKRRMSLAQRAKTEVVKSALRERFSPEQWAEMSQKQRLAIEVHGRKLNAVSTLLGIEGSPLSSTAVHFQVGEAIFGKRRMSLAQRAKTEVIKSALRERFTPEQWVKLTSVQRMAIEIGGEKLRAIATLLGVEGDPVTGTEARIQIGEAIFGQRPMSLALRRESAVVRSALRERSTPKQWAEMTSEQRRTIEVHGKKLNAIARLFSIEGSPTIISADHLLLGDAIFGKRRMSLVQRAKAEVVKSALRERFTPERWVRLTCKQREEIEFNCKKLTAMARLLGIDGNPLASITVHLRIGKAIWGKEWPEDLGNGEQ